MGAGVIVENNIGNACQQIWKKTPQIPELGLKLSSYDKPFVNLVSLVGAYALYKSSVWAAKKSYSLINKPKKIPTAELLQVRYGSHSWALIVDCKGNEEYCILLAQKGFNLILCGEEEDIQIAEDRVITESGQTNHKLTTIVVNWQKESKNLKFYEELNEKIKDFDISIIVMPTISKDRINPTSEQRIPAYEHIFLVARHVGPKLIWRTTYSAIIIPSTQKVDKVDEQMNGVTRAVQSGVDAFGRCLQYELKGSIDILIARGSAQNALIHLGKSKISH